MSLSKKMDEVQAQFDKLGGEITKLQETVNEGNRQIWLKREEQVRLQGAYRALQDLQNEEPKKEIDLKKKK